MKALALYSGGLDSTLAIALMKKAGIEVVALHFATPFVGTSAGEKIERKREALQRWLGVEMIAVPLNEELLDLVKNPHFGLGRNLNPCIDCHLLMLQKAKNLMTELQADFVISGEVLGQRPMSQHRQALEMIARKSGLAGRLVRPLCAKLLDKTLPELNGWIPAEYLLAIQGRGRKQQMALAEQFSINEYPQPAGGCLLTDPGFSRRLQNLLDADMLTIPNCHWIQYGRYFALGGGCKMVIARNESECDMLASIVSQEDYWLEPETARGPVALMRGKDCGQYLSTAASLLAFYCKPNQQITLQVRGAGKGQIENYTASACEESWLKSFLIT